MPVTCSDVAEFIERFVDGELHGDVMREVARHLARCESCEAVSLRLERLQAHVRDAVLTAAGEPNLAIAWRRVAPSLGNGRVSMRERVSGVVTAVLTGRRLAAPIWVGGVVLAAALVAVLLLSGRNNSVVQEPWHGSRLALQSTQSTIDRLETPGRVRVWNQPDNGALVIWVDDEGLSVERLDR